MAIRWWDPVHDLLTLEKRLDRFAAGPTWWVRAVDLCETPDQHVTTAEVPGLRRDELSIQLQNDTLTLSGARRTTDAACNQYHRLERGYGPFSRTFQLPHPVDGDDITAELRHGVLTVQCPKAAAGPTRHVDVG
jgi:HSP20 family protein